MKGEADAGEWVIDGRYRVLSQLGQGGMGTVYLAEHVGLGQKRAVKFLREELGREPGVINRFLQEARVLSSLHHNHVIAVLDMGTSGDAAYYVMELLEGEDLRTTLRRERILPWARARAIALQICDALAATHARGIIHRDLKPENCFRVRGPRDDVDFIKLIDFGIARVPQEAGGLAVTATGETFGTIGYMAPEQIEGRIDHRVDIYAVGVMLFEMLSGGTPHEGTAIEIIAKLARGAEPQRLSALSPGVAPAIEALVSRAMHRDPEARFADVHALAAALAAIPAPAQAVFSAPSGPVSGAGSIDVVGPTVRALPQRSSATDDALDATLARLPSPAPARPQRRGRAAAIVGLTALAAGTIAWWIVAGSASPPDPSSLELAPLEDEPVPPEPSPSPVLAPDPVGAPPPVPAQTGEGEPTAPPTPAEPPPAKISPATLKKILDKAVKKCADFLPHYFTVHVDVDKTGQILDLERKGRITLVNDECVQQALGATKTQLAGTKLTKRTAQDIKVWIPPTVK